MKSLWQEGVRKPCFPALQGDETTEVLIIGGGIAGILTAYFLQKKGVPYLLAEKDTICGGTTHNTTAKLTFQHGLLYDKLLKSRGAAVARAYLDANRRALERYEQLCADIPCDFEKQDNYVYSRHDRRALEAEMRALESIGYAARFCETVALPFPTVGAVCVPEQAQFHPLKFLYAIAEKLQIREHTPVREMIGSTALTPNGRIRAKKVVVTTHFPFINKHGSYFLKLYQHRSYVLALENVPKIEGMYLDEQDTGVSFRRYGAYLLLGGGGHRTGKSGGNWEELRSFAAQNYPDAQEKYAWAAQDCMSLDSVPYIGRYSAGTGELYTASGFNKWGMTGAMVSAMLLCDLLTGEKNPYEAVFSPSRSMMKPQLLVNGLEAAKNLLTPSAKRCPHLGCALKWNKAEHSWDCACHGSRFAEDGRVLDNPANGDLNLS